MNLPIGRKLLRSSLDGELAEIIARAYLNGSAVHLSEQNKEPLTLPGRGSDVVVCETKGDEVHGKNTRRRTHTP